LVTNFKTWLYFSCPRSFC